MRAITANVGRGEALRPIPGMAPSPLARPPGCAFRDRCFAATQICAAEPALTLDGTHGWRCFHPRLEVAA